MKLETKSKVNPFNYHIQREKFSVVGKNPHKIKARPGQAREHAIELRKNTLLKEYKARNKSGYIKDRRIGENDPTIDAEKKTMLRFVASKKREAKRAMYNLNDDEVLTHKGEPLNNNNMQDVADFSDEEQSDDEGGNIDGEYVKEQHFGGGLFSRGKDDGNRPKTKKEWIEEIIVESKKKKMAAKEEKTMQEEAVADINETYSSFMKAKSTEMMSREDKEQEKKQCAYSSYDKIYLELLTQESTAKAKPTDRLKTDEEIENEYTEIKRLHEIERKKRMMNAFEQQEDRAISRVACGSADALGQCFQIDEPVDEEDKQSTSEKLKKSLNTFLKEKEEDKTEKRINRPREKKFPKTFEVSDNFDDFWEFFRGYSPNDVSVIITKIIENNHPTTGKPYEKCCQIFAFLLKVLGKLAQPDAESLSDEVPAMAYVEVIMPGLFQLVHLSPATSTNTINDIYMEKFSIFSKTEFKDFPFGDTFVFLRVACILFPASDFEHDCLTPAFIFLSNMIGNGNVKSRRDIVALVFSINLLLEYCKPSQRFTPDIIWGLRTVLYLAVPNSPEKENIPSPENVSANAEALTLLKNKKKYDPTSRLEFSLINDTSDAITDKLKTIIIAETLTMLSKAVAVYSELSIAKLVFADIKDVVSLLPADKYPTRVRALKEDVMSAIQKLSGPGPQQALNRARAKAITFYEPRIEVVRDSKWKKNNPQEEEHRLKLIHKRERKATKREVKKDFQFLADIRLKETIERDTERKRKLNTIMRELGGQEGQFQRYKKMKK